MTNGKNGPVCPMCETQFVVSLGTSRHPSLDHKWGNGYRDCTNCNHVFPWPLKDGQKPTVTSNRATEKRIQQ